MADTVSNIAKAAAIAVGMVVSIVGNSIVAYVLIRRWKVMLKNRPTYQFILNLVLSDLLVSLLLCPFEFARRLSGKWIFGEALCKIIDYTEISAAGTAVISHALIATDRYRSLAFPHLPKLKSRFVRLLIALSWIVPAVASAPYLYMFEVIDHPYYIHDHVPLCTPIALPVPWLDKLYEAVEFGVLFFSPFCVICWSYYHVIRVTLGTRQHHVLRAQISIAEIALRRRKRRVTKTACLIVVAFIICWSPTFVLGIWRIASGTESVHHGHALYEVSFFGAILNEAINPIIYSVYDQNMNILYYISCGKRIFNETREAESLRSNERMNHRASVNTRQLRFAEGSSQKTI